MASGMLISYSLKFSTAVCGLTGRMGRMASRSQRGEQQDDLYVVCRQRRQSYYR